MATNNKKSDTKPEQPKGVNGLAVSGFILSLCGFFTIITFFIGLILSAVGLSQAKRTGQEGRGMALAGVIIGAIGTGVTIIFTIIMIVLLGVVFTSNSDFIENTIDRIEDCDYSYGYNMSSQKYEYDLICD